MEDRVTAQRRQQGLSIGLKASRPPVLGHKQAGYVSTDGVFVDYDDGAAWYTFMALAPTIPPPPDPVIPPDPPAYTPPTPAYIIDTDYETGTLSSIFAVAVGTHATISTVNPHHGSKHFRDTLTGAGSVSEGKIPAGVRQIAFRDWFSVSTTPSQLQYLISFIGSAHNFSIRINASRVVSMFIGSSGSALGSAITAGTYHVVDGVIDITGDPATYTARLDGGSPVTLTIANTPGDFTNFMIDQSGNNTITIDHDQFRVHNTASFYPLSDA